MKWSVPDCILIHSGYLSSLLEEISPQELTEKAAKENLRILGFFDSEEIQTVNPEWPEVRLEKLKGNDSTGEILFSGKTLDGNTAEVGEILSFLNELEYCYGVRIIYSIDTCNFEGLQMLRITPNTEAG